MRIAIGADHRGAAMGRRLHDQLLAAGHDLRPVRLSDEVCDYPDVALPVAQAVGAGTVDRGILICGTGIGMSIAANKVRGVRAAAVCDEVGAEFSRRHNDANVLCLSGDMLSDAMVERIVRLWLETEFEGGRHERRLQKITAIEQGRFPAEMEPISRAG